MKVLLNRQLDLPLKKPRSQAPFNDTNLTHFRFDFLDQHDICICSNTNSERRMTCIINSWQYKTVTNYQNIIYYVLFSFFLSCSSFLPQVDDSSDPPPSPPPFSSSTPPTSSCPSLDEVSDVLGRIFISVYLRE